MFVAFAFVSRLTSSTNSRSVSSAASKTWRSVPRLVPDRVDAVVVDVEHLVLLVKLSQFVPGQREDILSLDRPPSHTVEDLAAVHRAV